MKKHYVIGMAIFIFCGVILTSTLNPLDKGNQNDTQKRPFVISTDMGIDDILALLYLFQHPQVEVKAVTVCGNGMAYCGPGVKNLQGIIALGWPWNIPVTCGRQKSLRYNHVFPLPWRRQCTSLFGLKLPANPFPPSTLSAADLLINTIKQSHQPVILLALGPLTDVAVALQKAPSIEKNLEMIYIMGGAVNVEGNVAPPSQHKNKKPLAEYNIHIDPLAAEIVFKSGVPITLVPLDACNRVPMNMDFYKRIIDKHLTPQADFVLHLLTKSLEFIGSGHYFFWDPLTAVIATDNQMATIKKMRISVLTTKGDRCGQTIESPNGSSLRVCIDAQAEPVKKMFLQVLNGE